MSQNAKAIAFENELDLISDLLQIHNHTMNKKMEVFCSKNLKHDTKEHDLYLVDLAKWGYADLGETFAQLITTFKTSAALADLMGVEPNEPKMVLTVAYEVKEHWKMQEEAFIEEVLGGELDKLESLGHRAQYEVSFELYKMLLDSIASIVGQVISEFDTIWEIKERDEEYFSEDNIEEGIKELADSLGFDKKDLKDLAKILGM
ncbi:hypothetical protein LG75P1_00008 [Lactococcus phage LG75P1]|nr:hypothetical protein LG75P1_00008 [Lactococcus phage LG75P1]WAX16732.1 hypothetical protein LG75P3_00008 [Lactococcus phage LG75P3]